MITRFFGTNGRVTAIHSAPSGDPYFAILAANLTEYQSEQGSLTPAQLLADAQASRIAILSTACAAQIYAGFSSAALGTAYTYPAKDKDQTNLIASVTASLVPNPIGWTTDFWCADSAGLWALRPHTAAQIQKVGLDGKAAIEAAIKRNATLATQVMAVKVTDVNAIATVQAIVW